MLSKGVNHSHRPRGSWKVFLHMAMGSHLTSCSQKGDKQSNICASSDGQEGWALYSYGSHVAYFRMCLLILFFLRLVLQNQSSSALAGPTKPLHTNSYSSEMDRTDVWGYQDPSSTPTWSETFFFEIRSIPLFSKLSCTLESHGKFLKLLMPESYP